MLALYIGGLLAVAAVSAAVVFELRRRSRAAYRSRSGMAPE